MVITNIRTVQNMGCILVYFSFTQPQTKRFVTIVIEKIESRLKVF